MDAPYSTATRALHWATVALLVFAFGLAWSRDLVEQERLSALMLTAHRWLGLTIGVLALARLAARLLQFTEQAPASPSVHATRRLPRWSRLAAGAAHTALYGALLVLPVLGWLTSCAQGHPVVWMGLHLPSAVGPDPDLADQLGDIHGWIGIALACLVGLHVAAVLWHTWVRKDGVIQRMWPIASRASRPPLPHFPPSTQFKPTQL